ncbi:DUF551 domain-containing protein [Cronobacter muytjensii]|nr:DUF551 domain-containing protein [Cronobacter muytjensii]
MSEWIKCSDQMPPVNTDVMVTDGKTVGMAACRQSRHSEKHFPVIHSGSDWSTIGEVTHWAELPKPPVE